MGFYTSPSFFMASAFLVVPAAVLGLTGRSMRAYGMTASCLMVALLFTGNPQGLAALGVFLTIASLGAYAVHRSWCTEGGAKSLAVYRAALLSTIVPLVIYKVGAVFDRDLLGFIGISYITFKAVQVLIEMRDGLIERMDPLDYLYFLTFFATFTSGPIDRSRRFVEDIHAPRPRSDYADLLTRGVMMMFAGAAMQLVLATIARGFYDASCAPAGTLTLDALTMPVACREVLRAYGYAAYLFFDFAGYSLMAMGLGRCFGIAVPANFRAPYIAVDIKDFWNRWHITLSTWLRDFVFMRFVRMATKRKLFSSRLQTACAAYMVDMALMGAWHGLTVDYLVYGIYHGVLLAVTEVYQKRSSFHKRHRKEGWYKVASWFVTLQLVVLGFALFSGQVSGLIEAALG